MNLNKSVEDLLKIVDSSEVTDYDISNLRDKMKEIEKVLKEKSKPKTITISGYSHKIVKDYCSENGLNMAEWSSKVLLDAVDKDKSDLNYNYSKFYKNKYSEFTKNIDLSLKCVVDTTYEEMVDIMKKKHEVSKESKVRTYIKSEEDIDDIDLLLVGYDMNDGYSIYLVCNDEYNTDGYMITNKLNSKRVSKSPIVEDVKESNIEEVYVNL